jgi:hypothetical protein
MLWQSNVASNTLYGAQEFVGRVAFAPIVLVLI